MRALRLPASSFGLAACLLGCGKEPPPAPPELPGGRLIGFEVEDEAARFVWIENTASGQRLKFEPMDIGRELRWSTGGTVAMHSHLSAAPGGETLLFSGVLPLERADEFLCRPYALSLPAGASPAGQVERLDWAVEPSESERACAYRWFGDAVSYRGATRHRSRREGRESVDMPLSDNEALWRVDLHPGGKLALELRRGGGVEVRDGSGKSLRHLADVEAQTSCIAPDGGSFLLWESKAGATLYAISEGNVESTGKTLPLANTPKGEPESWGVCTFSPDGGTVLFSSNRYFGDRSNPMAGVSNPIRSLHAWNTGTGQVDLVLLDEFRAAPLVWLPPKENP